MEGVLSAGTASNVPIGDTVNVPSTSFNPVENILGSTVNGFFLSVFMIGATGSGQSGSLNWLIYKERTGQGPDAPNPAAAGDSPLRNQIIHQEKGLAGSADGTPMAFKGVVGVPRVYRRFREGDRWFIRLSNTDTVNDVNFCVRAIYNSYR